MQINFLVFFCFSKGVKIVYQPDWVSRNAAAKGQASLYSPPTYAEDELRIDFVWTSSSVLWYVGRSGLYHMVPGCWSSLLQVVSLQ